MRFVHIPYSDEKALSNFLACESYPEAVLKANIAGYFDIDIQEDFEKINIKDFFLVRFKGKAVPFQVLKKNENQTLDILSYYVLKERKFRGDTWRDSKIRKYLNSDFLRNFDADFLSHVREKEVHTEDYVTKDKFWLLSHEEVNHNKDRKWYKPNDGCSAYDMFPDDESRKRMSTNLNFSSVNWMLRSFSLYLDVVANVNSYGDVRSYQANAYSCGILPACVIS